MLFEVLLRPLADEVASSVVYLVAEARQLGHEEKQVNQDEQETSSAAMITSLENGVLARHVRIKLEYQAMQCNLFNF
eukprot:m.47410 g.47410  ORF g.47410 m.47410 type:complete len:77 (-) comp12322_c0_seq2:1439-1669(-)